MTDRPMVNPPARPDAARPQQPRQVTLDTGALFGASTEIRLQHRGEEYRLRITRAGKLILTK